MEAQWRRNAFHRLVWRVLRRLVPWFPFALVLCGCSSARPPLHFQLDGFTDEQRAEVQAAADEWNAVALEPIDLDGDGSDWRMYYADLPAGVSGSEYYRGDWVVRIEHGVDGDWLRRVALHELGHAHGLDHVVDRPAVMTPDTSAEHLTQIDIDACRRVGACK